ncbi:uncharacterized protein G2W53_033539 [Senna tora]|uniref:Uncharacterized protein n=1 Tax=Senna tora TaxID=362788 RepID=A0A834SZD5_9FABA|nr:uncharacterized protein G2W53_033539 [Senna tora]
MCYFTSESNRLLRVLFGIRGSNARKGLVIAWKVCQVMSKDILNRKSRLYLKRTQELRVQMYCFTSESNRSVRVVFGNPSGFKARMGLVISWKVCQVMPNHILNRKSWLNLKRTQEVQVQTFCFTSESNRLLRVVFANSSGSNARRDS